MLSCFSLLSIKDSLEKQLHLWLLGIEKIKPFSKHSIANPFLYISGNWRACEESVTRRIRNMLKIVPQNSFASLIGLDQFKFPCRSFSIDSTCKEMSRKLKKSERKPWVTSVNELKRKARMQRRARQEVSEITLRPPQNGLLVKALVPLAHEVYAARAKLLTCASTVLKSTVVYSCW